jgi:hypothetical protein
MLAFARGPSAFVASSSGLWQRAKARSDSLTLAVPRGCFGEQPAPAGVLVRRTGSCVGQAEVCQAKNDFRLAYGRGELHRLFSTTLVVR